MLWKIYFWLTAIISLIGIPMLGSFGVYEAIDFLLFVVVMIGYFGFAWRKPILNEQTWKVVLLVTVVWNILYMYFLPVPSGVSEALSDPWFPRWMAASASLLFAMPLFIALFLYAYHEKETWESTQEVQALN